MRGLRWIMNFNTLGGKSCQVYIYDEGYTGSTQSIVGTDEPFFFEESDTDDMLSVIRYKTGYIRVIEHSEGELTDLYPQATFDKFVEVYYGGTLIFTGFIQLQNISEDWVAYPRVLEFPVISPLGLIAKNNFSVFDPPQDLTLGYLMSEVMTDIDGGYTSVIFPDTSPAFAGTINSLVINPTNSEFSQSLANNKPMMKPINHEEFVEALCNAYGWMAHDLPGAIVFTQYDYKGNYATYSLSNLATLTGKTSYTAGSTERDVDDYFTLADNAAKREVILPKKNVVLSYEGGFVSSAQFEFSKFKFYNDREYGNMVAAFLEAEDNMQISGPYVANTNIFNSSTGHITNNFVNVTNCGTISEHKERILIKYDPTWSYSTSIFTLHFYNPPSTGNFTFEYKLEWGNMLQDLGTDADTDHYNIVYNIRVGSLYYQGQGAWSSTRPGGYSQTGLKVTNAPAGPVHVEFYPSVYSGTPVELLTLSDIKLSEITYIWNDYKYDMTNEQTIGGGQGVDDADVKLLFSAYRRSSNMIGSVIYPLYTNYLYILNPMDRLQIKFRAENYTLAFWNEAYICGWRIWKAGWWWRIVAITCSPREDEFVLTLHHSSIND